MKLRIPLFILVSVLIIPATFLAIASSETGSRLLLQRVFSALPRQVSVKTINGRLIDRVELFDIHYQSDTETIAIDHLVLVWNAARLFLGTLDVVDITVQGAHVQLLETREEQPSASFELPAGLHLPLRLNIGNALLSEFELQTGEQFYRLDKLQMSAGTENELLNLRSLILEARPLVAQAYGKMSLGRGFPVDLHVDWRNLQWPMTGTVPQVQSEQGSIELSGLLTDYRLTVNGRLTRPGLPKTFLTMYGEGRQNALTVEKLALNSAAGSFQLTGKISWQDDPTFALVASGQDFNPAIVLPELPGSLSFTSNLKGKITGAMPEIDADLEQLTGKLRGYSVAARGKLHLSGNRCKIEAFRIISGINQLTVDGSLESRQSDLKIMIDTPSMDQLWPGLAGSLKGQGRVQGAWKNPGVKLQAKGKQLSFAGHEARQLGIDIDYHPEAKQASRIFLSASAIKSGGVEMSKILIEGAGSHESHRLAANIRLPNGDLSAALSGNLKGESWQGSFSRVTFQSADWGLWQLEKNLDIRIAQKDSNFDVDVKETCVLRKNASICAQGSYRAEGDFRVKLKATNLPLTLVRYYLPERMAVKGVISGNAGLQRQNSALTGSYRVEMPQGAMLHLLADEGAKDFTLAASSLSGTISNRQIVADLSLALLDQDYVRGQLRVNTDKSKAISGQISASMVEFSWLKFLAPKLSDIRGDLKADLSLKGSVAKPEVHGALTIRNGAVGIAGHRIDPIDIEATASDKADRIEIRGFAKSGGGAANVLGSVFYNGDYQFALKAPELPLALLKPYLPEQLAVSGKMTIDADLRQRKGLRNGQYRLELPAGAKIIDKYQQPWRTIPLGVSQLTGAIGGEEVSANFDLGLAGKDYLKGRLLLDFGKNQKLDGRMTAAIAELALFNPLLPQLSEIKGQLHADAVLHGTVKAPIAQGSIELSDGEADIADLGLSLREVELKALTPNTDDRRIQIQGSAKSGEGVINLDGYALLQPGRLLALELSGENFEVAKLPEAEIALSPALKLAFDHAQNNVTGQLNITKADIKLKQLPENSISVSKDEIILGHKINKDKAPAQLSTNANIEVDLGKNFHFSGFGLKTDLFGRIRVNKSDEKIALQGNVDMSKATYKSYGQDLTVRKGRFLFNGPVDNPWLDVEAIRVSKDQTVTAILGLSGSVKAPKTQISSKPPLPQAEALAYLITGNSLNRASKSEGNAIAAAALSYGAGQLSWIVDKLGIDEFDLRQGDTLQDTLVAVGQYLNPDFYVGAKVGLFNKQATLILKHKITNSVSVETHSGDSHRIKLNYELDAN